jgi:hypothetical protein
MAGWIGSVPDRLLESRCHIGNWPEATARRRLGVPSRHVVISDGHRSRDRTRFERGLSEPAERAQEPDRAVERGDERSMVHASERTTGTAAQESGPGCERVQSIRSPPQPRRPTRSFIAHSQRHSEWLKPPAGDKPTLHRGTPYSSTTWCCSVEEQEREAGLPRNEYILAVAGFIVLLAHGAARRARSSEVARFVAYHPAAAAPVRRVQPR